MANKNSDKQAARALQAFTGWSYQHCLQLTEQKPMETIKALIEIRGVKYNAEDERYLLWKERAKKASGEKMRS